MYVRYRLRAALLVSETGYWYVGTRTSKTFAKTSAYFRLHLLIVTVSSLSIISKKSVYIHYNLPEHTKLKRTRQLY